MERKYASWGWTIWKYSWNWMILSLNIFVNSILINRREYPIVHSSYSALGFKHSFDIIHFDQWRSILTATSVIETSFQSDYWSQTKKMLQYSKAKHMKYATRGCYSQNGRSVPPICFQYSKQNRIFIDFVLLAWKNVWILLNRLDFEGKELLLKSAMPQPTEVMFKYNVRK